jgi:hypothetical protein
MIQLVSILTDSRPPTTPPSYVRGVSAVQKVPETKAAESKGTAQQIHGHLTSLKICMSSFVYRDQGLQGVKDRGIDGCMQSRSLSIAFDRLLIVQAVVHHSQEDIIKADPPSVPDHNRMHVRR